MKKNLITFKKEVNSEQDEILNQNRYKDNDNIKLFSKIIKISKSSSNLKNEFKLNNNTKEGLEIHRNKSNQKLIKNIDYIKKIKQAKELKDLEKIYQRWSQEKNLNERNNIKTYKMENENLGKSYENTTKLNIKKSSSEEKKKNNEDEDEERKKIFEKIKGLKKKKKRKKKKKKKFLSEDFEKVNKKELERLYQKSYLLFDNEDVDFIEKLEYIIEIRKFIQEEIKYNNDNLIPPGEAIYSQDIITRFLGYFGSELSLKNINVYIENNPTNEILRDITFKIITSGLATQKIYKIIVDNERDKLIFKNDMEKWFNFLDNLKKRISTIFNISDELIHFFGYQIFNLEAYLLIYNQKINNMENLSKNFKIKIISSTLLNNIILSTNMFNSKFSKDKNDWPKNNLIRGGRKYNPPYGWNGIALKIKDKFKTNNDIWLGKKNFKGEWAVAYHGVGKGNVFNKVLNIINSNLKEGQGQLYRDLQNIEKSKEKYISCGEGVYLSPNVEEAMKYADRISLGCYYLKFKFVIMARVNPNKIRSPGGFPVDWILNGNEDEIRPYRLLIKEL